MDFKSLQNLPLELIYLVFSFFDEKELFILQCARGQDKYHIEIINDFLEYKYKYYVRLIRKRHIVSKCEIQLYKSKSLQVNCRNFASQSDLSFIKYYFTSNN